jgi:hypothetical protein
MGDGFDEPLRGAYLTTVGRREIANIPRSETVLRKQLEVQFQRLDVRKALSGLVDG